jgi:hypothetical protein
MRKRISTILLFGVLLLMFLPIPTRIVKDTEVRVLLTKGEPMPGIKVSEDWECFGMFGKGYVTKATDSAGLVRFPARYGFGSVLSRLFFQVLPSIAVHASYGFIMTIGIDVPDPMRAVFSRPEFKPLEPFSSSGTYLDSVGRDYSPREVDGGQMVAVRWNSVDKAVARFALPLRTGSVTRVPQQPLAKHRQDNDPRPLVSKLGF